MQAVSKNAWANFRVEFTTTQKVKNVLSIYISK
jgi:hypothetical protein